MLKILIVVLTGIIVFFLIPKARKRYSTPEPVRPKKTSEEIAEENRIWLEKIRTTRFRVDRKDIPFDLDENEVFFFTPERAEDVENAISSHYYEIKNAFEQRYLSLVFLPFFNKELNVMLSADKVSYYSPHAVHLLRIPNETLTYQDIKESLKIPEMVCGLALYDARVNTKIRCYLVST